jgi:hypothetical protein
LRKGQRDSKGRFIKGHSVEPFKDKISKSWFERGNKINLGRKRPDVSLRMKGNNFNPSRIENLKPFWNDINRMEKKVKKLKIGSDEQKLIDLFHNYKIPFNYIGNSGFHLEYYFPDFISEDKTTLLEFIINSKGKIEKRRRIYEKHGFRVLFIPTNWIRRNHIHRILKYMDEHGYKIENLQEIWKKYYKKKVVWNTGKKLHYPVWNKGLTKDTDERIMSISQKMIGNQNFRGEKM